MHLAAVYGSLEAIRIIANELEDKNPPAKKLSYYTPLHFATVQNHVECIEYILELGIDANTKAYLGRTPLHIAAEHGHIEAVKCLLKHVKNKNPALGNYRFLSNYVQFSIFVQFQFWSNFQFCPFSILNFDQFINFIQYWLFFNFQMKMENYGLRYIMLATKDTWILSNT